MYRPPRFRSEMRSIDECRCFGGTAVGVSACSTCERGEVGARARWQWRREAFVPSHTHPAGAGSAPPASGQLTVPFWQDQLRHRTRGRRGRYTVGDVRRAAALAVFGHVHGGCESGEQDAMAMTQEATPTMPGGGQRRFDRRRPVLIRFGSVNGRLVAEFNCQRGNGQSTGGQAARRTPVACTLSTHFAHWNHFASTTSKTRKARHTAIYLLLTRSHLEHIRFICTDGARELRPPSFPPFTCPPSTRVE